jgi:hypothetical protein
LGESHASNRNQSRYRVSHQAVFGAGVGDEVRFRVSVGVCCSVAVVFAIRVLVAVGVGGVVVTVGGVVAVLDAVCPSLHQGVWVSSMQSKKYSAEYVRTCLLTLAATVSRVVDFGEPMNDEIRKDLEVLLASIRHEQKKRRLDDPEWRAGRCQCCWSYVIDAEYEPEEDEGAIKKVLT